MVAAGDHAEAPVLDRGVEYREPDGQNVGLVDLRQGDTLILVPGHGGHHRVALDEFLAQHRLGWLDTHVLDRIGEDLAPN